MENWIETKIQAILDAYVGTTNLTTVAVHKTNSQEKKYDKVESTQIQITLRDTPGELPKIAVADKIYTMNAYVVSIEEEKSVVEDIITKFIETYNNTKQTEISAVLNFTNLSPFGSPDNIGSKMCQTWSFAIMVRELDSLTSIFDRTVTIGTKVYNALNGLVGYEFNNVNVYAEYPSGPSTAGKKFRYRKYNLRMVLLDSDDTDVAAMRATIYGLTYTDTVVVQNGALSVSFTGYIMQSTDAINESGFPLLSVMWESG